MSCQAVRCLIVDDSAGFREAARAMLERAGASVVGVASNSAEALKCFSDLRPDITLVDVDLGEESGFDLVDRLCAIASLEPSTVILISSHAEQDFSELIASSPAAGFVSKLELTPGAIAEVVAGRGALCRPVTGPPET